MALNIPLKHVRLTQLASAGFNVADFICFPPGKLDPVELKEFFEKHRNGISLRHFHSDELQQFQCPVKYEVTDWEIAIQFCQAHNREFFSLINEVIPLKDSLCAGVIVILNREQYFVEYFEGPGTPRDVEKSSNRNLKHFQNFGKDSKIKKRRQYCVPLPSNCFVFCLVNVLWR